MPPVVDWQVVMALRTILQGSWGFQHIQQFHKLRRARTRHGQQQAPGGGGVLRDELLTCHERAQLVRQPRLAPSCA